MSPQDDPTPEHKPELSGLKLVLSALGSWPSVIHKWVVNFVDAGWAVRIKMLRVATLVLIVCALFTTPPSLKFFALALGCVIWLHLDTLAGAIDKDAPELADATQLKRKLTAKDRKAIDEYLSKLQGRTEEKLLDDDQRVEERYRHETLAHVYLPDQPGTTLQVHTRNISRSGLCLEFPLLAFRDVLIRRSLLVAVHDLPNVLHEYTRISDSRRIACSRRVLLSYARSFSVVAKDCAAGAMGKRKCLSHHTPPCSLPNSLWCALWGISHRGRWAGHLKLANQFARNQQLVAGDQEN